MSGVVLRSSSCSRRRTPGDESICQNADVNAIEDVSIPAKTNEKTCSTRSSWSGDSQVPAWDASSKVSMIPAFRAPLGTLSVLCISAAHCYISGLVKKQQVIDNL